MNKNKSLLGLVRLSPLGSADSRRNDNVFYRIVGLNGFGDSPYQLSLLQQWLSLDGEEARANILENERVHSGIVNDLYSLIDAIDNARKTGMSNVDSDTSGRVNTLKNYAREYEDSSSYDYLDFMINGYIAVLEVLKEGKELFIKNKDGERVPTANRLIADEFSIFTRHFFNLERIYAAKNEIMDKLTHRG